MNILSVVEKTLLKLVVILRGMEESQQYTDLLKVV
jgi:hypothetical protein